MKIRYITLIVMMMFSIMFVACTHGDALPSLNDGESILEQDVGESIPEEPEEPAAPVESDQDVIKEAEIPPVAKSELLPCISNTVYFSSQNEMTQQLKTMRSLSLSDEQYETYSALSTAALSHYYALDPIVVSDYDFATSWINPKFIFYAYETKDKSGYIEFEYSRVSTDDPLLQIEQRYGIRRENNVIFVPHQHTTYFVIDGSYLGLIRVGGSLDTGTIEEITFTKYLSSQITSISLNNNHVTE